MKEAGPIGQLLARQAEAYAREEDMESLFGQTCSALPNDMINFLHDPLACAIALGWDDEVDIQELPLKSEIRDGYIWQTLDASGKPTRVVSDVNGSKFSEFWLETVCTSKVKSGRHCTGVNCVRTVGHPDRTNREAKITREKEANRIHRHRRWRDAAAE